MENKLIVVVGATGRQGGAVVKSLLSKGYRVRALVRNPQTAGWLSVESGVEIFNGDLKNKNSLKKLFDDAYGLFFALPYTKDSIVFGKNLLNVAKESSLEHIVYSSVGGAERYSKVDHFCYKKVLEEYLKSLGKPYSIIRPAGFMEEFADPKKIKYITGLLALYLSSDKVFQLISIQDIGRFVAIILDNPKKYLGKELEIAGDELTLNEVFRKIEKVNHVKISPVGFPKLVKYLLPKIVRQMFVFYAEDGWRADLSVLREDNPELLSFEDWLAVSDARYG